MENEQNPLSRMEQAPPHPAFAFLPGQIVVNRYRIVTPIGQGGMGCVYRADDLTLHQTVALKFLSAEHASHPLWLSRFRQEVRLARDVTHPNVCRVHDIGEADGVPFISMEYVDGEDLAGLLRRIGRVPEDKGVEIAEQICAGLAAAHIRGVLHRDLKPANIMIDSRGRVRITDFGLAGIAGQIKSGEIRAGTPRYMAPEQIAGIAVSEKSDIYSLGLVLYELFTGKPAFTAEGFIEYAKLHKTTEATDPSSIVPGLNPRIAQIIQACLRKDPDSRPDSALYVAASLPGADLLAAALAVGETPSPEILATAAEGRHIPRRMLVKAFVAFVVLFILHYALAVNVHPVGPATVPKPPQVLAEKARELIARYGYSSSPVAHAAEMTGNLKLELSFESPAHLELGRQTTDREDLVFWYRQSEAPLVPIEAGNVLFGNSRILWHDPPSLHKGMAAVVLDPAGQLLLFQGNPLVSPGSGNLRSTTDWSMLFRDAGLQEKDFSPTPPLLLPGAYASERRAWLSTAKDNLKNGLRVEAAADRNQLIMFAVLAESVPDAASIWTDTEHRHEFTQTLKNAALLIVTLVAIPCAWRNIKQGRSDRRGALGIGLFIIAMRMAIWILVANHTTQILAEARIFGYGLLGAIVEGAMAWLFYLALEPSVRRLWPQTLLAWSKVLQGRLRDPFVAGNIVIGGMIGVFWAFMLALEKLIPIWCGWSTRADYRLFGDLYYLLGTRQALGRCLDLLRNAVYQGLFYFLLIVFIRVLVRQAWLAVILATLIIAMMFVPIGTHPLAAWVLIGGGLVAVAVWAVVRYGLVTIVAAIFVNGLLSQFPLIPVGSPWFGDLALFGRMLPILLVLLAFIDAVRLRMVRPRSTL